MFVLLSFALAIPSPKVKTHIEYLKEMIPSEIPVGFKRLQPNKQHALAKIFMEDPSVLAILNRHKKGEGVVEGVAKGTSSLYFVPNGDGREYVLKHRGQIITLLALQRRSLFPISNPFSINRAQTFQDSIEAYKRECRKFTPFHEGFRYAWSGSSCSFGEVWIEWDPTQRFSFVVLTQKEAEE